MNLKEYINEVTLETNPELNQLFEKALRQVFSPSFVKKIDKELGRTIKVKEVDEKEGVIAYNKGQNIFVNKNEFYKRERTEQIKYLLHEFMHVIQRKRGIFFRKFKEMKKLTNELNKILKKGLKQPLSVFLTGKKQNLGPGGKWEIISYFMNNSIKWDALEKEYQKEFVQALSKSGMFNLGHPFWKKRLP
jgi:NACalpha-BTF3-like transcription factor